MSPLKEAIVASVVVTGLVTALSEGLSRVMPAYVALSVAATFLGATWLLVLRFDDETVRRFGLALGGLVLGGPFDWRAAGRQAAVAIGWALVFCAVTFVPFFFGWRHYWHAGTAHFAPMRFGELANDFLGQLLIIALPEEAFYRGYLQSRLDDAWRPRWSLLGATVGPSLIVTSLIFALGHLATIHHPARLAVFFPALAFGWLRARTGGIGASATFHALCNMFSELLGRVYGIY